VVCPWHSWNFDLTTGMAEFPEGVRVRVFAIRQEAGELLIQIQPA
jgi:nitrite reductase (NADH) small subunit